MKTSTRLDSAVFQLTPTRTRCDLVIYANGKTEKIASGLVSPFLAHLKTAQDQMAKGGYSLIIEPEPSTDATWFTKETVERFVRFVSTPEVLERVHTLESEILQIEEAIAIQSNNDIGLSTVEEAPGKPGESIEGSRPLPDCNEEKAIVLYNPGAESPEVNTSTALEGNSKVQLLKVLETRRTALQKEQGMAFARAVAAGFDVDRMAPLISFAESFGATRLMKACVRFMELWRRKHETGQWLELEEAEAMYNQPDYSAMNASGIMLSNVINRQKEFSEGSESNGKTDEKPTTDQPGTHPEYFQGQFPHPMYPPWPIHSPPGAPPVFPGYPMQGMQYYQSPYFQAPYPSSEDPRSYSAPRMGRRHSMDSRDSNNGLETQDNEDFEKETSRKKGSRSSKKKSGKVVIRNLNYITSKREDSSDGESESPSNSESDDEDGELHKSRSSRKKESQIRTMDGSNSYDVAMIARKEEDGGQWQAFQSYLLRDADEEEKEVRGRRRQGTVDDDPLISRGQDMGEYYQGNVTDFHTVGGKMGRMRKGLNDELLTSGRGNQYDDGRSSMELQSEINGRSGYRRTGNDDFMINRQENMNSPSDPLVLNGFERSNNGNRRSSSQNMDDDSYIVARSSVAANDGRNGIDLESELPPTNQTAGEASSRVVNYEPDELILMPDRGKEKGSGGYDPAFDYEVQANVEGVSSLNKKNKEADVKKGSQKAERNRKLKMDSSDRKTGGPIRKGRPSKLSPLDEARARAEKLRSYKADLQKMKKEKEEEETRRLEALKVARQKRIAAKSGSVPAQSSLPSLQTRRSLPTKLSPSTHKASKFSDAEPGPSSPLQRFSIKTPPVKSADSSKVSKTSKLNTGSNSTGNRLTRSGSSLTEPKRETNGTIPDTKVASMTRIRRLSEPKMSSSSQHVSSSKSKPKVSDGSEVKKLSAIVNHDKSKAASLPELKVRKSKEPNVIQKKAFEKEPLLKDKGTKSSTTGDLKGNKKEKTLDHHDIDDNLVIEKTVVVQEYETASVPAANTREEHFHVRKEHCVNSKIEENEVSDYAVIRAPVSSSFVDRADKEPIGDQCPEHHTSYEVKSVTILNSPKPEKESPKYSSVKVSEEPYQAPYARVSSLEDVCTDNTESGRIQPTGMQVEKTETNVTKLHMVSKDFKPEKVPETLAKMQIKESPKGFRRLLKFGKKSHISSTDDRNFESDSVSVSGSEVDDVTTNAASSSEVHTLKNLISQDETSTAGATPQKSSRSFSLLSPFRSKNSEKKLTT